MKTATYCLCVTLLLSNCLMAQSDSKAEFINFQKGGITYTIFARVQISKESIGYKMTLETFNGAASLPQGVNYNGKNYREWDFNNEVGKYMAAIKVRSISIKAIVSNLECSGSFFINFANQGATTTIGCKLTSGNAPFISDLVITDLATEGFPDLENFLRKSIAAEKPAISQKEATATSPSKTDPVVKQSASSTFTPAVKPNPVVITTKTGNTPTNINSSGYDQKGNYVGTGNYNKEGSGTFIPNGPGKLRTDGNYDVVDKNTGRVEVISKSENQRIIQQQAQRAQAANLQAQQQKMQDQFKQQQLARQQLAATQAANAAQMSAIADQAAGAIANLAVGIGGLLADAKAKKEREKRLAFEREQRRIAEEQRLAAEQKFRLDSRTGIFSNYKPGNIPTYTSKVSNDIIYYFVYAFDEAALGASSLPIYLSNVFAIKRASDGTWPYKRNIEEAIEPLSPYKEILHGYYNSEEEAKIAREGFIALHQQIGAFFTDIAYKKEKKSTGINNSTTSANKQFWDSSFTPTPKQKETERKAKVVDPMWDANSPVNQGTNNTANEKASTTEKKKIDFWSDEPIKKPNTDTTESEVIDQNNYQSIFTHLEAKDAEKASEALAKFPPDTNDLLLESLRAHTLLLSNNTAKALEIYKKHSGKLITQLNKQKWEDKIKNDITQLQKKGIEHEHFPLILTLLL